MRILFIGTGEIGLPAFQWLLGSGHEIVGVVTQPDKPAGRKQELLASPIKQAAAARGLPVLQPRKIREPESVAQVAALAPDLVVVMAYGQILSRAVLDIPRVACLNLHASLLPRHRGAAPIQAAILSGDPESGITVMYMDEGLDTGDILLTGSLTLEENETGGSLHDRLANLAPHALEQALHFLETGTAPRRPQDASLATYSPKLGREDGLVPWHLSEEEVDRHIRAMNPWPGAYTWLPEPKGHAKKLKIFSTKRARGMPAQPGAVMGGDADGLLVGCGSGAVLVQELQLEGKRRMTAREFLLGRPVPAGTVLGLTP